MRKNRAQRRKVELDPIYSSIIVSKLVNTVLKDGKKALAERSVYEALELSKEKIGEGTPLSILEKALANIKPSLEVRSRRIGGATYQIPVEVKSQRASTLSIRWLVKYARLRREKTFASRLSAEIVDAYNNVGASVKKREDTHKMADANKAFAHYRW